MSTLDNRSVDAKKQKNQRMYQLLKVFKLLNKKTLKRMDIKLFTTAYYLVNKVCTCIKCIIIIKCRYILEYNEKSEAVLFLLKQTQTNCIRCTICIFQCIF